MSVTERGWTCHKLDVVELLQQGEKLTYEVAKVLYYLSTGA